MKALSLHVSLNRRNLGFTHVYEHNNRWLLKNLDIIFFSGMYWKTKKNTQIHKYKNTHAQIHKYTNTQIHRYTNTHTQRLRIKNSSAARTYIYIAHLQCILRQHLGFFFPLMVSKFTLAHKLSAFIWGSFSNKHEKIHARTHTHTHTHTQTQIHIHTHIHTHTHTHRRSKSSTPCKTVCFELAKQNQKY